MNGGEDTEVQNHCLLLTKLAKSKFAKDSDKPTKSPNSL